MRNENFDADGITLAELSSGERQNLLKSAFFQDPDIGPTKAWEWAYQHQDLAYGIVARGLRELRQCGYVMYDCDRLRNCGILNKPFQARPVDRERASILSQEKFDNMWRSFDLRSKLWETGARGWWSEGDESKLTWLDRRPEDGKPAPPTTRYEIYYELRKWAASMHRRS